VNLKQEAIFLIHGITCLIGWFVILNSLDYFHSLYFKYDVYEFFLLSILVGYLIAAVAYRKITSKFSIQRIVNLGLIGCTASILLLLATAIMFKNAQHFGFMLSILICIVVGITSNIVQLSYFAMINFVPEKVISRFTIGTAFSGLFLTILRIIITAIAGTTPHFAPIFIYFLIACAVQILDLFLNNIFCRSQYFL
jgi:hypothetical protein